MFSLHLAYMAGLNATIHCITRSTGNIHNAGKTLYRDQIRVVELLLQFRELENKQQMMQNNVENQHKHMYSLYI